MLGGIVRCCAGHGGERVDAGDLHDCPAGRLLGDHLASDELREEERALQVDVEDPVPFLLCHLQYRLHVVHAGVVDEAVDPAEPRDRGFTEPAEVVELGYIGRHGQSLAAGRLDLRCQRHEFGGVAGRQHHPRSRVGAALCDRRPEAAAGAGDDHDAMRKQSASVHP